ncbi:HPr kinase/phosphatase C-terminal domain-containing protein [uncultured Tateyamaria sp.]|uniref:HPr kinase/phosphorylase n=1 Tax=uncultured Tateyamaria sp. TaxID=455651 RepID=UPI002639D483|nr:HPr kinase/phosphatase C-terminal domain-containing protein [uncultured Tateyamaria sp.]
MADRTRLHASSVALDGKGVLITGASGSGKSSLALQLMAMGCTLVADDQTELARQDDLLWASAPTAILGVIEARGVGLLHADTTVAAIDLVIDLDQKERDRLPQRHEVTILGLTRPCLHNAASDAWPAAIIQYLQRGRQEPQ